MPMMLHLQFDEIESASDAELLRLYRLTLFTETRKDGLTNGLKGLSLKSKDAPQRT